MQKFDLSLWLQDKSRKVVTRAGKSVRIICWDSPSKAFPIVGFVDNEPEIFAWDCFGYCREGHIESENDLFFVDEEQLTEFEKALDVFAYNSKLEASNPNYYDWLLKSTAINLLDLARKELEKSIEDGAIEFAKSYMEDVNPSFEKVKESEELWKWKMSCLRGINKAYTQGKRDVLKDFPKWKKAEKDEELDCHVAIQQDDRVVLSDFVQKDEYYITLDVLKKLPKEE